MPDQGTNFLSFVAASQYLLTVDNTSDPKTFVEAMSGKDSWKWKKAIDCKSRSFAKKNTWSLVRRSSLATGTKVLSGRLVLKTKR